MTLDPTPSAQPDPGTPAGPTLGAADGLDVSRPHPARVYQAWLGGKDTFGPDRDAAERVATLAPWVIQGARANRSFLRRAVRHLSSSGIDQFVDLGAGLPAPGNVHEVAQAVNPAARVVYVDLDPVVLIHARALLACDARTIAVPGDLRDPAAILTDPDLCAHLDLSRPVAVLLLAVLHFVRDSEDPARIVAELRERLAPGSAVVISHVADLPDGHRPERTAATREAAGLYEELAGPFALRTPDQIGELFEGLDLLDPGVVPANQWRPTRARPGPPVPILAGVARIPASSATPGSAHI